MKQDVLEEDGERKAAKRKSTRNADPWYKRNPQDIWDGTRELSLEARGAYNDVLDLIYIHGGALQMSDRVLAGKMVIDVRKWACLKRQLIAAGKLFLTPEGWLHNHRAAIELLARKSANDRRSTGGGSRRHRPDIVSTSIGDPSKKANVINGPSAVAPPYQEIEREKETLRVEQDHHPQLNLREEVFSLRLVVDDDDQQAPLSIPPSLIRQLEELVSPERAQELVNTYLASDYARNAKVIDKAFAGWLKRYGVTIRLNGAAQSAGDLASQIVAMLPRNADGTPNLTLPKLVNGRVA